MAKIRPGRKAYVLSMCSTSFFSNSSAMLKDIGCQRLAWVARGEDDSSKIMECAKSDSGRGRGKSRDHQVGHVHYVLWAVNIVEPSECRWSGRFSTIERRSFHMTMPEAEARCIKCDALHRLQRRQASRLKSARELCHDRLQCRRGSIRLLHDSAELRTLDLVWGMVRWCW